MTPRARSFRRMLLVPVLGLVLISFGMAALLGGLFGTRATHYLVQQLVAKSTDGLRVHLQRYLEKPHLAARVNADAVHGGQIDVYSLFARPESWFLERHRQFPDVDDIYFGRSDGAIVGVDKVAGGLVLKLTTAFPRREFYRVDSEGRRSEAFATNDYDARERDWYRAAVKTDGPIWSPVYVLQNRDELGITAARPVRSAEGRLIGVMGVNLTLQSISDYLREQTSFARTVAYIVEPDGLLVATSSPSPGSLLANAGPADAGRGAGGGKGAAKATRLKADQSPHAVIAASYQALQGVPGAEAASGLLPLEFNHDGRPLWIYQSPYRDPLGIDWRLITVIDPAPFLHGVHQVGIVTLVLGALALTGLLVALPRITRQMASPIEQLAHASKRLAAGQYGVEVTVPNGSREVRDLVAAFNDMSRRLGEAHERLQADAHALAAEVQSRTAELQRLAAELADDRNRAEQASENKTRFLAHLSHEIRTPLNAIAGLAYLLHDERDAGIRGQRLDTIEGASRYVARILDSMLDLSKIEAGRLELRCEPVDVAGLVGQILRLLEPQAQSQGIELRSLIAPLPAGLLGDPVRLQQALVNLVGNAVRVTSAGSVTVEVAPVPASSSGASVTLNFTVIDTGPGIAPDEMSRLFDPYVQGKAAHGGAGLGLAIARGLAERMRGDLTVESRPGEGSRFRLTVRLLRDTAGTVPHPAAVAPTAVDAATVSTAPPAALSAQALSDALTAHGRPLRVLVVDDDPVNQIVAQGLMAHVGCECDAATSGAECLDKVKGQDYDLILMDVMMPGMDGLETTRRLRAMDRHRDTIILGASGLSYAEDFQRCLEAGMTDALAKPIDPGLLFAKMARLLKPPSGARRAGEDRA